jgi:hypothetical protein
MPYIPNSMVMDRTATSLYFGSSHELMIYSTATNALSKEDPNVPGVVLAAAPDNQTILINDPIRKVFYLYKTSGGTFTTFSGVGTAAQWTPDAKTLYVTGTDANGNPTMFVNNVNTGWTTYPLAYAPPTGATTTYSRQNLAITVPSAAAFVTGTKTVAHAWCPSVNSDFTIAQAYPEAETLSAQTDALAATTDGIHVLGVGLNGGNSPTLTDIDVNLFQALNNGAGTCPTNGTSIEPISLNSSLVQVPLTFSASAIDQVVPSPASNLAFITYQAEDTSASSTKLPYYQPNSNGSKGTYNYLTLTGSAPVAGAFSLDDRIFFVSTSGDNQVHYIDVTGATPVEIKNGSTPIKPGLVDANGNAVPATVIAVKPRSTT